MSDEPSDRPTTADENSSKAAPDHSSTAWAGITGPVQAVGRSRKGRPLTLRAQCHTCGEAFDMAQLYAADPVDADRCPRCAAPLGSAGLGHTTFRIERHLLAFTQALQALADHPGAFTIDAGLLRIQVLEAIDQLDEPPALDTSTRIVSAARL